MIFSILLSILSIYPWNADLSGFATLGEYTEGGSYQAVSSFLTFDRRLKDKILIGFERSDIEFEESEHSEETLHAKGIFWMSGTFRPGLYMALLNDSNGRESIAISTFFSGEFGKNGYDFNYVFHNRESHSIKRSDTIIHQYDLAYSYEIGPYVANMTYCFQRGEISSESIRFSLSGWISRNVHLYLEHSTGDRYMPVRIDWMTVSKNPDILERSFRANVSYKFTPNYYLSASFLRSDYTPNDSRRNSNWDYKGLFYTLGFRIRY